MTRWQMPFGKYAGYYPNQVKDLNYLKWFITIINHKVIKYQIQKQINYLDGSCKQCEHRSNKNKFNCKDCIENGMG